MTCLIKWQETDHKEPNGVKPTQFVTRQWTLGLLNKQRQWKQIESSVDTTLSHKHIKISCTEKLQAVLRSSGLLYAAYVVIFLPTLRTASPLKMGPTDCPETSANDYQNGLRNITEEARPRLHSGKMPETLHINSWLYSRNAGYHLAQNLSSSSISKNINVKI